MIVLKMMYNAVFSFFCRIRVPAGRRKENRKKHDTCHEPIATENKDILSNKINPSDKYVFLNNMCAREPEQFLSSIMQRPDNPTNSNQYETQILYA